MRGLLKALAPTLLLLSSASALTAQQGDAAQLYQEALRRVERKQFVDAVTLLDQILQKSPSDVKAQNLLGIALTASGRPADANAHFEKAVGIQPDFYPALKNLAINELSLGQVSQARGHFEEVLRFVPDDPVAHLSLGEICFGQRLYLKAVEHYLRSGDLLLRNPNVALNFARSCFAAKQPEKAAKALERFPEQAGGRAHFQAGLMLAQLAKYDAAARQFELAERDYPDAYEAGFNLVLAYVRGQHYTQAIAAAQALLNRGYGRAELYNLLAEAYERNGQTLQAYNALRTATQLDPKDEDNYLDLMALGVDHANYELALDIANIALGNIPDSFRLIMQRGAVRAFQGQLSPAMKDFERAAQLDPQDDMPYFAMCMALMQTDQVPRALEILRGRLATHPDDYLLLYALGESADRSAGSGLVSEEEALRALERSVQANPNLATSRLALGRIYLRRNEVDLAISQLERALEIDPSDLSPCYQLAQAYRRKGDKERAEKLMAQFEKFREEDRERHINRNLLKLLRQGEQ